MIKFGTFNGHNFAIYLTEKNTVRIDFPALEKRIDYTFEYLADLALLKMGVE